jgi:hypothetical protein
MTPAIKIDLENGFQIQNNQKTHVARNRWARMET